MRELAVYLMLGYPDLQTSLELMDEVVSAGVDVLEVGFPFSDPIADGGAIQMAAEVALSSGVSLEDALQVGGGRRFLMTYANILHHYGYGRFEKAFSDAGYEGVIIPDVPPEHNPGFMCLSQVYIAAPNCSDARVIQLAKNSSGFLYVVSHLGTTGGNARADRRLKHVLGLSKLANSGVPRYVGFGISTPERAEQVYKLGADGVVVGSAFIHAIERDGKNGALELLDGFLDVRDNNVS